MNTLSLILSLTTGLASPVAATQSVSAAAIASSRDVAVRIDHAALLDHERATVVEHTVSFVREDVTTALGRDHGVTIVEDPRAAAILVGLSWVSYEDSIYGVTMQTQRPGEAARLLERFECECINSGLAKAVVERLPAALAQLEPPAATPSSDPGIEEPATEPVDAPPERVPLGTKGKVGIGLLTAGVVGAVMGGIVLARGRRYTEDDPEREVWTVRDFGPPGVGVLVAGGVVAVTGVVLLVIDRVQARPRERAARRATRLTPTRTGLAFTLRF